MVHTLNDQVFIATVRDDGTLAVMSFLIRGSSPTLPFGATWESESLGIWTRPAIDVNIFAELLKVFPVGQAPPVSYKVVSWNDVPKDRTYRNAWTHDGNAFGHNMVKAKEIHREHIRMRRDPVLEALDKEWMKVVGQNKKVEADTIEAQRQILRDAPAINLDAVTTITELKAAWPVGVPAW